MVLPAPVLTNAVGVVGGVVTGVHWLEPSGYVRPVVGLVQVGLHCGEPTGYFWPLVGEVHVGWHS